jgi:hypothetical protein
MIVILRTGFKARITVGKGEKQIPLGQLTAVQFKPCGSVVKGFIQFTIGGGIERRSQFGGQTSSAVDDENSVLFDTFQQHAFEELRDAVQSALAEHHGFSGASQRTEPAVDIPKQIKQLAELRDSGVLDDAEFGAKKAELLRRM